MTINKLILSALTASVLTGTAFAGTLEGNLRYLGDQNPADNSVLVATELANASVYTYDIINIDPDNDAALDTLSFVPAIDGSTTVSDPTINFIFPGDYTVAPLNVGVTIGVDAIEDADAPAAERGLNIAVLQSVTYDPTSGTSKFVFKDDSTHTVQNSHAYFITTGAETAGAARAPIATMTGLMTPSIDTDTIRVELWSTSGTEELRSYGEISVFDKKDQFKVTCVSKFDGMINFENAALTFVPTGHGLTQGAITGLGIIGTDLAPVGVYDQDRDAFTFAVQSDIDNDIDYKLDGVDTTVEITGTTNPINAVQTPGGELQLGGAPVGNLTIIPGNILEYKFNVVIPQGTSVYTAYANVDPLLGLQIAENVWSGNVFVDGGVHGGLPVGARQNPAIEYTANGDAGEWKNFTYIAQIAGATQTAATQTKLFIVNRSCTAVTPELTFIMGGKKLDVTLAPLDVDAQAKVKLGDVIAANAAAFAAAGMPTEGQYALELTLPGNAEDFYVYAQAQSKTDIAATKDLPVYNTSTRD